MRLLALVTDAFGGRGGIAKFNRDLLQALHAAPQHTTVRVLPRVVTESVGAIPDGIDFARSASNGKLAYASVLMGTIWRGKRFDGVICGHINLLPLAFIAARWTRSPLLLIIHGVDAWTEPRGPITRALARRVDLFVAVSQFTKRRFLSWARLPEERGIVVPNCIEPLQFGPGPRRADLVGKHDLRGHRVLMTMGRMSAEERYKGVDEVLDVLPQLSAEYPGLVYLIVGAGTDLDRLKRRAKLLEPSCRVEFAGYVPDERKADYYRLADAFVMPGRGEGFGIVYLEAMACGVPVVASSADASQEAVRYGQLGLVVDPEDPGSLVSGIRAALCRPCGLVPEGLEYFSVERFGRRWAVAINRWQSMASRARRRPI